MLQAVLGSYVAPRQVPIPLPGQKVVVVLQRPVVRQLKLTLAGKRLPGLERELNTEHICLCSPCRSANIYVYII